MGMTVLMDLVAMADKLLHGGLPPDDLAYWQGKAIAWRAELATARGIV